MIRLRGSSVICMAFLCAMLALSGRFAAAQGRPDLIWMRGAGFIPPRFNPISVAYSSDGKFIATGDRSYTKLWRVADGMLLQTLFDDTNFVAFSPVHAISHIIFQGGKPVMPTQTVVGVSGTTLRVWSVPDGALLQTISPLSGNARSLAISPDGQTAAVGLDTGTIELRSLASGALKGTLIGHASPVISIAYSPDGQRIASGGGQVGPGNNVRVWDAITGVQLYSTAPGGEENVEYLIAISKDSKVLYTGYGAVTNAWDIKSAGSLGGVNIGQDVTGLSVASDGKVALVGQWNGYTDVYIYPHQNLSGQSVSFASNGSVGLAFTPDSSALLTASESLNDPGSGLSLWGATSGALLKTITTPGEHTGFPSFLSFSGDGSLIAQSLWGSRAHTIVRRSLDGAIVSDIKLEGVYRGVAALSPDSKTITTTSLSSDRSLWTIALKRVADQSVVWSKQFPPSGNNDFNYMICSPDGRYIYAACSTVTYVFNAADGSIVHQFQGTDRLSLSRDGSLLAIGNGVEEIQIIRTSDWALLQTLQHPSFVSRAFALSPDGKSLIEGMVSYGNYQIVLWDVASGHQIYNIPMDSDFSSLAFSPDGQVIVSSMWGDADIQFWLASDGTRLSRYNQQTSGHMQLAYSPDGKYLYYERSDDTIACALNPYRNAVFPTRGGNTGNVTVKIITPNTFPIGTGTLVTLSASGQPDIIGTSIKLENNFVLDVRFDLTGAPLGSRDVVITNADGSTRTYPQGFTVEPGVAAGITTDIIGRAVIRGGISSRYYVMGINSGNIDSTPTTLGLAFPNYLEWSAVAGFGTSFAYPTDANTVLDFGPMVIPGASQSSVPLDFKAPDKPEFGHRQFSLAPFLSRYFGSSLTVDPGYALVNHQGQAFPGVAGGTVNRPLSGWGSDTKVKLRLNTGIKAVVLVDAGSFAVQTTLDASSGIVTLDLGPLSVQNFTITVTDGFGKIEYLVETGDSSGLPVTIGVTGDPNDLSGSPGYGAPQWVSAGRVLRNLVTFANEPEATAPVAFVSVVDHLDPTRVDTTTVQIGAISLAGQTIIPTPDMGLPVGKRQFSADIDLRPGRNLLVHVTASLDMLTGDLTWTFTSIDPNTGLPLDPADPNGFLDPGQEGSVLFSVMPKPGLPTGTVVSNQATIVFDANAPMDTPAWFNTLDNDAPVSKVNALPAVQTTTTFNVSWQGTDVGSGLRDFTISVSDNGGPFAPWLTNTTDAQAAFTGQVGHKYAFMSVARDNVFNTESAHLLPDATTSIVQDITGKLHIARSGLVYNRQTKQYTGTITLTNIGGQALAGPFEIVLNNLTGGATLVNASGLFRGAPYLNVNASSLAPGASVTVPIQFSYAGSARLDYTPAVYSGSF